VRHVFDLNARPDVIAAHLGADDRIGSAVARCPGLRVPGSFSGFELAWRAILGQRVSVRAATTISARLAAAFGEPIETPFPPLNRLTPDPSRVATAGAEELILLGMTRSRAASIQALARAMIEGHLRLEPGVDPEAAAAQLKAIPGIGEWTAQYVAMRALGWPDAFPHGDLGLLRALDETSPARLHTLAETWRPWRSYAVMHLWNGTADPTTRNP
jgi:AraC family transcriptional regulator of adaptative response / DNA-3-methyladenine glycosylase II